MTDSELRVAITGPPEAAGLRIDPALTDTILGDLRAAGEDRSAGVLPLLSQAMALTWEQREGDRLTSHGYAQSGGVSRAVQTGADRVYGALSAGQQAIAREVLRSMTVASRDGGLARRPVTREDLDLDAVPGRDLGLGRRLAGRFRSRRGGTSSPICGSLIRCANVAHGMRGEAACSTTVPPIRQRSPTSVPVRSRPWVVRFSRTGRGSSYPFALQPVPGPRGRTRTRPGRCRRGARWYRRCYRRGRWLAGGRAAWCR